MFTASKYRHIDWFLKGGIALLLGWTLYREIWLRDGASHAWRAFQESWQAGNAWLLLGVFGLMPLNWGLEALKWRQFMRPFHRLGCWEAFRAVLSGVTLSLITPNRIGDYGGRLLGLPGRLRWYSITATALSGFCQLIVVLLLGLLGVSVFAANQWPELGPALRRLAPLFLLLVLVLLLGLYRLSLLLHWLPRLFRQAWFRSLLEQLRPLAEVPPGRLHQGLLLAVLRYSVYALQYFLMLRFFGVILPPAVAFAGIATVFLIQTGLPLPPMVGLLARGEVAMLIWGGFQAPAFSVLAATFGLFLINLGLPALLGLAIIVRVNIFKSETYEDTHSPAEHADGPGRAVPDSR